MTQIPSSDNIAGAAESMFVSPSAEWIAFFEGNELGLAVGLTSVQVATGRRVAHNLDQVPSSDKDHFSPDPFIEMVMAMCFRTGWHEGALYLMNPARGPREALIVRNSEPAINCGPMPTGQLMVSDGPCGESWYQELRRRPGGNPAVSFDSAQLGQYSAAWRDNHYSAMTYAYEVDSNSIVVREPGGGVRKIASLSRGGPFQEVTLILLRVSPDESYLAYVEGHSSSLFLTPFNMDVLKVIDLESGKTRSICSFRFIRNLFWSADGTRLFLAGNDPSISNGAYVADIANAFGKRRN
jgi:hypothetical protein